MSAEAPPTNPFQFGGGFGNKFLDTGKFNKKGRKQIKKAGFANVADFINSAGFTQDDLKSPASFRNTAQQAANQVINQPPPPPPPPANTQPTPQAQQPSQTPQAQPAPAQAAPPIAQNPQQSNINNMGANANATTNQGGQTFANSQQGFEQGNQTLNQSIDNLNNSAANANASIADILQRAGTRNNFEDLLFDMFESRSDNAIDPNTDNFDDKYSEREALINDFYGSDAELDRQARQRNADITNLQEDNVLDSGAGDRIVAARENQFAKERFDALRNAFETSRAESLGERGDVRKIAQEQSGNALEGALTQGQLENQLRQLGLSGTEVDREIAETIGNVGGLQLEGALTQGEQGIDLLQTGLDAQDASIGRGLESTGLIAELEQARSILGNQFMMQILELLRQGKADKQTRQLANRLLEEQF